MIYCRFCGTKEVQFRKSGKFGCVHCAQVFEFKKPKQIKIIPENRILVLENFVKENRNHINLLSLRTRITRNLNSNLFPFYDPLIEKSKQLLVDFGMGPFLIPKYEQENENQEKITNWEFGFYLGSEDHIRLESIRMPSLKNFPISLFEKKRKISILRFLFQKSHWAYLPELGFVSSCPTNLGLGRRDSILLEIDSDVSFAFFSILQTLSEFGIEFAPSTDHRFRNIGKDRVLIVKISWKNALAVQKRQFYKILGLLGSY
ncbi:ATP--guanido phosphotransferase [Leptospira harrisiae]|uniref:ATP--guanido phosphotransferase n=1 Tax=Leptospira harrisiae TaxID=2023189 RepID=A0A2N0AHK5_9LEPT|nr:ATP--guanido phosphotransferase [Leptospira harrisiae]PJZ83786.1 ATP--guanido phosphotransferase [Leptospira harrisiae]PKA07758.1 ATP--guanido phosphotransferase [Leptospira harrisiae]